MRGFILGVVVLILSGGLGASAQAQSSLGGEWVGGYEINGNYTPIKTEFSVEGAGLTGTVRFTAGFNWQRPEVALAQVRFQSPNLHFEWGRGIFEGQLGGDFITGNIQYDTQRGTFYLVHSVSLDAKIFDQYLGDYEIGRNSYVSIGRAPAGEPSAGIQYTVHDLFSPEHRHGELFPVSETSFVAGPGRWMPYPVEINASFVKNKQGQVTALKWKAADAAEITAKKVKLHLYDDEEITFTNGNITLAGTLSLPLTKGPHPAVVLIAGSDPNVRTSGLPHFFAQHGIAALSYDKRGNGASTGTLVGATVIDMAGDAAAGVRYLQKRPDIDSSKVGLWAVSQGGWLAPVVATTTPNVAFMILHAGPAVSPRLQGRMELMHSLPSRYGDLKQDELDEAVQYQNLSFDAMNSDEAYDKLQAAYAEARQRAARWVWNPGTKEQLRALWARPNVDFDPVPFLEKVQSPVIAFFGEKDSLVPPEGNVSIMEAALKKAGNKDVTIKLLPGVNHNFQQPGMGTYGFQSSGKTPAGYYDVMIEWLKKRLGVRVKIN